ncbi:MAG: CCA tRNA nucleotidyltransferase [Candidatus Pacebacteria bacterium]|nr:CCA tRNA nucleotidyltransferase [Candidatus Paceibacterota bacterium]
MTKIKLETPKEIIEIIKKLQKNKFEAFLVGGCVRDLILNKTPSDWDITTNANPEEIQNIFKHTFYENDFGTVGVVNDEIDKKIKELENKILCNTCETINKQGLHTVSQDNTKKQEDVSRETLKNLKSLKTIEITPYRIESSYSNNRHPDNIKFSDNIEDDLQRRDFTINALAYNPLSHELLDLFNGISDLNQKIIKTVGDPEKRFNEDALRILRAVRFSAQLNFDISKETKNSIIKNKNLLKNISNERIRDEFIKILQTKNAIDAFFLAHELKILDYISKDLTNSIGVTQGGAHKYDVFEHLLKTMQHAIDKDWSFDIRLAGLFHDIAKPHTARWSEKKNGNTFYGHEVVGEKIAKKNLERLNFPKKTIDKVLTLIRWHMFFSDPDKITLTAVRRIIRNVGEENIWDLIKLRICDRIGMGRPKEKPYRLRQYQAMMDEAMRSPISVKDLKINGDILINEMGFQPGKKIGLILNALMGITLYEPEKNNLKFLKEKIEEYKNLSDQELEKLAETGKEKIFEEENKELKEIHKKHKVN